MSEERHTDAGSSLVANKSDNRPPFIGWGFLATVLGTFSLLTLLGHTWWICGGLGFLGCTLILIYLNHHQPPTVVRTMAIGGLCLSLLTISYAPTQYYLQEMAIARQAELFGNAWIKNILSGKPSLALAAMTDPEVRLPEEQIVAYYKKTSKGKNELRQFENKSLVKSLLALNGSARADFFQKESLRYEGRNPIISMLFAVTYLETPLKKKTFFVRLVIKRNGIGGAGQWSILTYRGGVRPRSGAFASFKAILKPTRNSPLSLVLGNLTACLCLFVRCPRKTQHVSKRMIQICMTERIASVTQFFWNGTETGTK